MEYALHLIFDAFKGTEISHDYISKKRRYVWIIVHLAPSDAP